MTNPEKPWPETPGNPTSDCKKPTYIGAIIREVREAAGLTRHQLVAGTEISVATLRNLETNRHPPTAAILRKLLRHPALAAVPELARRAGL